MKLKSFILILGFVLISNFLYAGGGKGKNITKALEIALSKKVPASTRVKTPKSTLPGAKVPAKAQVPTAKNSATKAVTPKNTPKVSAPVAHNAQTVGMFPTGRIFKQGYHTAYLSHEQAEELLSIQRGKELLKDTLDTYITAYDSNTQQLKQYIMEQYLKIAGSENWEIAFYETSLLKQAEAKGFDVSVVPAEVMQVLAAMTIREYVIKNGAKFPKFGENQFVDYAMLDTIWHKALRNKLVPQAQLVLAESFIASSTRGADIVDEAYEYTYKNHMLPGFYTLGTPYDITYYMQAGTTPDVLTEEAKQAVVLGTEYIMYVKILQSIALFPDKETERWVKECAEQMDDVVKQLEEIAPVKGLRLGFTYEIGPEIVTVIHEP